MADIAATATRRPDGPNGGLDVRFVLSGDLAALAIPPPAAPARRDDLWRRTCFEVFLRVPGQTGYLEFNLSPSGEWAAYAFTGYRERAADPDMAPPAVAVDAGEGRLVLDARLALPPGLPADRPWRASLTAVVETADGRHGYWAVAHAADRPDFHHADSFVVELPPPAPLPEPEAA
ncbi:DOMON-like domain-containing protein [Phenylobacterium sp.]|uniref:DOMON-like domain-containing protein n=1 Tax=Phenylobacterium sp. TaxID=1871053 RepID=UPI00301DAFC6